jgi:hypothetical protein
VLGELNGLPWRKGGCICAFVAATLNNLGTNVVVEGQPAPDPSDQNIAQLQAISPGYFCAMGM